jgi:hypothetical protein
MRQNARPILGFDGFKSVISVIKYQEFAAPSDLMMKIFWGFPMKKTFLC